MLYDEFMAWERSAGKRARFKNTLRRNSADGRNDESYDKTRPRARSIARTDWGHAGHSHVGVPRWSLADCQTRTRHCRRLAPS